MSVRASGSPGTPARPWCGCSSSSPTKARQHMRNQRPRLSHGNGLYGVGLVSAGSRRGRAVDMALRRASRDRSRCRLQGPSRFMPLPTRFPERPSSSQAGHNIAPLLALLRFVGGKTNCSWNCSRRIGAIRYLIGRVFIELPGAARRWHSGYGTHARQPAATIEVGIDMQPRYFTQPRSERYLCAVYDQRFSP